MKVLIKLITPYLTIWYALSYTESTFRKIEKIIHRLDNI